MSNKVTKVLGVDLDLPGLQAAVQKANKLIEKMGQNGQPPKNLISSFDKVDKVLDKLAAKTKDGVFKGTDAEYASLIRELGSVGEEFEHIERIVTQLGKMDDDALSKFLKKEDLKIFKDSTKALKEYYDIVKKLESGDSSVLSEAKKAHDRAIKNKTDAEFRKKQREADLGSAQQAFEKTGVDKKRKTAEKVTAELDARKEALDAAKAAEAENKKKVNDLQKQIEALKKQQTKEQGAVGASQKKLDTAQTTFKKTEEFYDKTDKDGTVRDKTKDYGEMSFSNAAANVKQAEEALAANNATLDETNKKLAELESKQADATKALEKSADATKNAEEKVNNYKGIYTRFIAEKDKAEKTYEKEIQALEDAEDEFKKAENELKRYETAEKDAAAAVKVASDEKTEAGNKAKDLAKAYEKLYAKARELGLNLDELGIDQEYSTESAKKLTKALEDNKKTLVDNVRIADDYETTLDEMGKALDENRENVEANAEAQKKLNAETAKREEFENKIKQFLGMAGAAQVLRSALRSAMDTIKELDATMTEMAVVTDLSVGDYWNQLPEYTKRANDLGLAINDVYKADTLFYQQGLKTNEVVELSTETMKMAKIAGLDTAEATDRMTAALRGFNMELDKANAQKISDVYSELAAITAADVEEISSAMTKTASIASSAGMEFETTAAFLSQIIETTRESAETAGTAMKTVIARFQELKKAPDEIGEIDGEIVDANAIETALRSVGVSLRDAGGQFRELDDVFLELSSKWDSLDKNTQRYIATIAAGSRQQSRFIAMMSDYGRTQELVTAANNSAGASARQYEKTVDSLETKLTKLKNAWNEFAMGILESDLVKTGIEILTKFLEIINKATSAFDGLGGSITKIMTVLLLFKFGSKLFEKLKKPLMEVFDWAVNMASPKGYEAGKKWGEEFARGSKEAIEAAEKSDKENPKEKKEEQSKSEEQQKTGIGVTIVQKSGWTDIDEGRKKRKQAKEDKVKFKQDLDKKKQKDEAAQTNFDKVATEYTPDTKEYQKAMEELYEAQQDYQNELKLTDKKLKDIENTGKEGTEQMAKGFAKMGEAAIGAGVGISMLGGLLSTLGLEELGEGVSWFGNMITMAGTAITAIIPIIKLLSTTLVTGGVSAQAAWWWAILIVAAVAALIIGLIAIANAVKNASLEAKLERAQEAADKAADAADRAAESYENLKNSFEGLKNGYKALEDLTRGTEEWNKAVEEINNSVLDLIAEYPELAAFVENKEGVLTIDVESDGVQAVLSEKQASVAAARNAAIGMQMEVTRAEAAVELKDIVGQSDTNAYEDELKALGEAIANGTVQQDKASMQTFLEEQGVGDAAQRLAQSFADNADKVKEFGKNLQQANKQLEAQYEAMATQAEMTADTTGWSEEEIMQGQNLVTGDIYKKFEKEAKKKAETVFKNEGDKSGLNNLDAEQERLLDAAIKQIYGEEAKRNGKKVTYVNENNETVTENLAKRQDQIVNAMTQISATEQTKAAMEGSKSAIATINKQFGSDIASKVYSKDGGGALSEADAKAISEKNLDAIWNKLNDNEKAAFANDKSIFKNKFKESADAASVAIGDVRNSLEELGIDSETVYKIIDENINKDVAVAMKGNFTKLAEMLKLQGKNATDISKTVGNIATQYKDILSKVPEELQSSLAGAFASIDASSIESLNHFKWELINVYGIEENAAIALTDALKEAGIATSSFELEVEVFGKLQEALEETTKLLDKFTDLQWEYNEALRNGTTQDILNMGKEQVSNLVAQVGGYKTAYEEAQKNIATVYASGATYDDNINQDYRRYVTLSKNGEYEVDQAKVQEDLEGGNLNGETFNEWLEKLSEQAENMEEVEEAAKEAYDSLVELEQQTKDAYYQLRELAENAVIDKLQEQINIQEQTLDATQRANDQMISKIQESIDDSRQARENAKVEESIEKMYSKQAYLASETSGANQLESQQLAKAIAEAEQSYQDSLIDQTLQNLQDANEKAAEQRERQITLAQEQLDAYQNSIEFQSHIEDLMSEAMSADSITNTRLGDLLREQQTAGMTAMEKADWAQQLNALNAQAKIYSETEWVDLQKEAYNDITTIADTINAQQEALVKKTTNQARQLQQKGFEVLDYNNYASSAGSSYGGGEGASMSNYEEYLDRMTTWSNESGNTDTVSATSKYSSMVSDKYTYLDDNGKEQSIMSQQEYNASVASRVAAGEKNVPTYSEYIDEHYQQQYDFMLSGANFRSGTDGWFPIQFFNWNGFQEGSNGGELDAVIGKKGWGNNPIDYYVGLGPSVTGNKAGVIKEVMKKTYNPTSANWLYGLNDVTADTPTGHAQGILYDGKAYIYYNGNIRELMYEQQGKNQANVMNTDASSSKQYIKQFPKKGFKFKTGGIADFTGPAWLDGTPSKPEYVLNSAQTERFFSLIDVLEKYDTDESKQKSGDNYFDIEINVEKLENDYDVEKLADKIRNMIYNDATYRNVNAINHIR